MKIFELAIALLSLVPAIVFLLTLFSSVALHIVKVNLQVRTTTFCLKAYGWLGEEEVCYANKSIRWGSGILFVLSYGFYLGPLLPLVVRSPGLLILSLSLLCCLIAFCALTIFLGSYYSGAVRSENSIIISPLLLTDGACINTNETDQLRIESLGNMCMVYCSQWEEGRLVLLSKKRLSALLNTTS